MPDGFFPFRRIHVPEIRIPPLPKEAEKEEEPLRPRLDVVLEQLITVLERLNTSLLAIRTEQTVIEPIRGVFESLLTVRKLSAIDIPFKIRQTIPANTTVTVDTLISDQDIFIFSGYEIGLVTVGRIRFSLSVDTQVIVNDILIEDVGRRYDTTFRFPVLKKLTLVFNNTSGVNEPIEVFIKGAVISKSRINAEMNAIGQSSFG